MAINPPTDYIFQVYLTEAAAIAGDTSVALRIDNTDGSIKNTNQNVNYGFWSHTKYWYRIVSNEPVSEFYIDWDDGEDNNPKNKANYTTIKFDTPSFIGIAGHIYTGNSRTSGGYFPKIRCKSIDGYWSKYYQNSLGLFSHTGIDILQGDAALPIGRNNKYIIESDVAVYERIPALYPELKPPIGVLKSDKRRVYAGIDNGYLRGTNGTLSDVGDNNLYLVEIPNNTDTAVRSAVRVRVTYQNLGDDNVLHNRGHIETTDLTLAGTNHLGYVVKVLKVELLDLLEDSVPWNGTNPATNKLYPGEKMALTCATYPAGAGSSSKRQSTIAEVSLGNPIVNLEDPKHNVIYDLTESFTRTPEQNITNYYIDDGKVKMRNGYTTDGYYQVSGHTTTANADIFSDANGVIETSSGTAKKSYAFDVGYNYVDSDGRWLPKQILARGQVKVSNPLGSTAILNQQFSPLEHWRHEGLTNNYSDAVTTATYNYPSDMTSSGLLAFKSTKDDDLWTDLEDRNRKVGEDDDNYILTSGTGYAPNNPYRIDDSNGGNIDHPTNNAILICARDSKWTKQFWFGSHEPASNYVTGKADLVVPGSHVGNDKLTGTGSFSQGIGTDGVGHMNTKVEIFYTGYESDKSNRLMWKPLQYKNYTKHPDYEHTTWYTDGSFEWEEPDDWVAVDPDDIPNEFYPRGIYFATDDTSSFAYSQDVEKGDAISEVQTISTIADTVDAQWYTLSGSVDVDDGLSIVVNHDPTKVVGNYFTFYENADSEGDDADVGFYVWYRQAATTTKDSFVVQAADNSTSTDITDFIFVNQNNPNDWYAKGFVLKKADATTVGFWLQFADDISDGSGGDYGTIRDPFGLSLSQTSIVNPTTIVAVDCTAITGSGTAYTTAIAAAIEAAIDNHADFSATRLSSAYRIVIEWPLVSANVGYDADAKYDVLAFASINRTQSDNIFKQSLAHGRHGKNRGVSPHATYKDLAAFTGGEIIVDYDDGETANDIATATRSAINSKSGCDVTASGSTSAVILTQDAGQEGAVTNAGDGETGIDDAAGTSLATGFTFATPSVSGTDTAYGADFFEYGDKWNATNKKYALMMLPKTNSDSGSTGTGTDRAPSTYRNMAIQHTWPCSNSHSVLVDLIDPMHVSLNNHAIVQSINYTHKGKYQKVEDRLGKSDIRKIGSSNGVLAFGGIDLKDDGRVKFQRYQNDAVPVYLDVENTNGDFTRFFGIIVSMSRDHPTGKMYPKYGLQMDITHIITMDSTGSILSDGYISLGGAIDEPKYT